MRVPRLALLACSARALFYTVALFTAPDAQHGGQLVLEGHSPIAYLSSLFVLTRNPNIYGGMTRL